MAITTEVIRRLTIIGQTQGLPALQAELAKVADAQSKVAASARSMTATQDTAAKSSLSAAKQYDALSRSIDPVAKANATLERGQRIVTTAINQGAVSADQGARTIMMLGQRHAETIAVISKGKGVVDASGHAVEGHTQINFKAQMGAMELQHAFRSMFDGMAAGMPISRLLMMEGFRLQQGFSMTGGLGGAVKAVGSQFGWVTGLLTPLKLLIGGTAIGALAAAASFISWETTLTKLQVTLNGLGRATGLTLDGLERIAELGGAAGNLSTASARSLAAGFAGTGQIGPTMIGQLTGASRQFGLATGTNVDEAGATLAKAFADPTRGADELNKALGFLDDRTRQTIKSFQDQGDVFSAQQTLFDNLRPRIEGITDRTWSLSKAWIGVGNAISNATHGLGDFLQKLLDPTVGDRLTALEKLRSRAAVPATSPPLVGPVNPFGAASPFGTFGVNSSPPSIATLADAIRQITAEAKLAREEAAQLGLEQQQIEAGRAPSNLVRSILPDIEAREQLENQKKMLERAMLDPGVLIHMGVTADQANQALGRLTYAVDNYTTALDRQQQDAELAVRSAGARTAAEKLAVDMDRARLQVLIQTHDVTQAALAAENARNVAIATANRELQDAARSAKDELTTAGLRSWDATVARIGQQMRDLGEKTSGLSSVSAGASAAGAAVQAGSLGNVATLTSIPAAATNVHTDYDRFGRPTGSGYSMPLAGVAVPGAAGSPFGGIPALPAGMNRMSNLAVTTIPGGSSNPLSVGGVQSDRLMAAYRNVTIPVLRDVEDETNRLNAATRISGETFSKTAGEIAAANKQQDLINKFTAEGIPITGALSAAIEQQARRFGDATQRAADYADHVRQVIDAMDGLRSTAKDTLSTFVSDLRNGQSWADSLTDALGKVEDKLFGIVENQAIEGLFGRSGTAGGQYGGALGGLLGGLFSGNLPAKAGPSYPGTGVIPSFHTGGIVGEPSTMRLAPLSAFAGAPRYHSGWGFRPGEVPAILEAYEGVHSRRDTARINRSLSVHRAAGAGAWGSGGDIQVNVHNYAGAQVETKKSTTANGSPRIDVMIKRMIGEELSTPGSPAFTAIQKVHGGRTQLTRR